MGPVTYKLTFPKNSRIHMIFHVSLLKKVVGSDQPTTVPLPEEVQPRTIFNCKMVKHSNLSTTKVLVQWSDLSLIEAIWEFLLYDLKNRFPTVNLEVKVSDGGVLIPTKDFSDVI